MEIKFLILFLFSFFLACSDLNESVRNLGMGLNMSEIPKMSGVFVEDPFYEKDQREETVQALKESGFTMVEIWTIHVLKNGTLNINMEFPIVADGKYIGDKTHPQFKNDVASLKQGSNITTVNFGLSAWGSPTFSNIKDLIDSEGMKKESILHRNFMALKEHFPHVDAIDFDDEVTYELISATRFGIMLADIGFKIAVVPYARGPDFWAPLVRNIEGARPGAVDAVYLQCYAGGRINTNLIGQWQLMFQDIPVYPGLDIAGGVFAIEDQLKRWKYLYGTRGGWLWLYDEIPPGNVDRYAKTINRVFKIPNSGAN